MSDEVEYRLNDLEARIKAEEDRSFYFAALLWVLADHSNLPADIRQYIAGLAAAVDPSEGARPKV
jgi:hypothetical protein